MLPLLVLAGGLGTRLQSVVADVPKPLAPVNHRPYLAELLDHWIEQGVQNIVFLLHHKAQMIIDFLNQYQLDNPHSALSWVTIVEPEPLGTGGAVAYAIQKLSMTGDFILTNADTWLGSGIMDISTAIAPAMTISYVDNADRYGIVFLEGDKISKFEEKTDNVGGGWINVGLYKLKSDLFSEWGGAPFSIEKELFPRLTKNNQLTAVKLNDNFIDIGVPEDYQRFCMWIESKKLREL
jgi:NDP-sugar pyrophosphorylase family protein